MNFFNWWKSYKEKKAIAKEEKLRLKKINNIHELRKAYVIMKDTLNAYSLDSLQYWVKYFLNKNIHVERWDLSTGGWRSPRLRINYYYNIDGFRINDYSSVTIEHRGKRDGADVFIDFIRMINRQYKKRMRKHEKKRE